MQIEHEVSDAGSYILKATEHIIAELDKKKAKLILKYLDETLQTDYEQEIDLMELKCALEQYRARRTLNRCPYCGKELTENE